MGERWKVALTKKKTPVVSFLLQRGAATEIVDRDGCTPLHSAAFKGNAASVERLLEAGAKVNHPDVDSSTPLHKAAYAGATECVRLLLDSKAEPDAIDVDGVTALHKASFNGHVDCVKLLLLKGADLKRADRHGSTALHKAAFSGSTECVKALLASGADPSAFDAEGHSAVHLACHKMHPTVLKELLAKSTENASLLSNNASKETPLHLASKSGALDCIVLLIEAGANVAAADAKGMTALDHARALGHDEIVAFLMSKQGMSADINGKGKEEDPNATEAPDAGVGGGAVPQTNGVAVDRWGFVGGDKLEEDEELHKRKEIDREIKWVVMRSQWDRWMSRRRPKLRQRCLKGIPDSFRPFAWVRISGALQLRASKPANYYQDLVARPEETAALEVINRDLHRTFPDHTQFRAVAGRNSLLRVLKAFSFHNAKIGYC